MNTDAMLGREIYFIKKAIYDPNYRRYDKTLAQEMKSSLVEAVAGLNFDDLPEDAVISIPQPEARADLIAWLQEETK